MQVPATHLRVHSIDYRGSVADGPGIRTVIYLQGCDRHCEGCHNPSTWDATGGVLVAVESVAEDLRVNSPSKALTISGGEPLRQPAAVLALVRSLPNFSVGLYTGEELDAVPRSLLDSLEFIKVGSFVAAQRCSDVAFIGSRNQRFIDLRQR